jgi:hypothetical protein
MGSLNGLVKALEAVETAGIDCKVPAHGAALSRLAKAGYDRDRHRANANHNRVRV